MSWFKMDDQFPTHPKVMRAGPAAAWLYIAGGCYCTRHLTDGLIPRVVVPTLTILPKPYALAAVLVAVLVLAGGACGSDGGDDDAGATTTSAAGDTGTTAGGGGGSTPTGAYGTPLVWNEQYKAWEMPNSNAAADVDAAYKARQSGGTTINITGNVSIRNQAEANMLLTNAARAAGLA